jgi:hypothetical protein
MKKIVAYCATLSLFALVSVAAGAGATNFSGTWALDKSKSQLPQQMADNIESMTLTVTQDDKTLTAETKTVRVQGGGGGGRGGGGGDQKTTYNLDGSETTTQLTGRMEGKATHKAKWTSDGKVLELSTVTNANVQGNEVSFKTTEHWESTDGGKGLKIHRVRETPRGTQETTYVYTKK